MRHISLLLTIWVTFVSAAGAQSQMPPAASGGAERMISAPAAGHIDGSLQQAIGRFRRQQAAGQQAAGQRAALIARLPVTIRFRSSKSAAAHRSILSSFGAVPANEYGDIVESYVSADAIEALAANPDVAAIDSIVPPQPQVMGQGAAVHNASTWTAAGHQGAGVKVGIIDVGFIGLTALVGSEVPSNVIGRCYTALATFTSSLTACETGTVHGTAVAEAVTDIAPGVQLYVANPGSSLDLRNTVAWMTSQGVRVINHSVGWTWSGPGDGTTPFADSPLSAVNDAVANGAVWMNAAGNSALSTWSGGYADRDGNGWLEFANVNLGAELNGVTLAAGEQLVAQARWEDSWTAAARDLDLYLVDPSGHIVAWSEANQDGTVGSTPRELFVYTAATAGTYYLAVHRFAGVSPAWVDVQAFSQQSLQYSTSAHSIANPAESANPGALAVGAVPWSNTFSLEPFSSHGPTRDGRMKPDLVAADRADSVSYGPAGFAGTSQASPHVAGLAALVVESFPSVDPRLIAQYLRTIAQSRGAPDNGFGAGFAQVPVFPSTISLSAVLMTTSLVTVVGQPVPFTAFAIGGQTPIEYKFWIYSASSGWSVLQDYSPANTAVWTPSLTGTYSVQVWVRHIGSSAAYEDWRDVGPLGAVVPPPVFIASFGANVTFPSIVNTSITWTAAAGGGAQPLQYQFWRFREGAGWSMVRDYAPSNTFTWTPLLGDAGRYQLQVFVRAAGSFATYEAWAGTNLFDVIVPQVVLTSLTSNVSFPAQVGTPITWTASAVGGAAPLQYQFLRFKEGAGWTVVQPYSGSRTFSWTPSIAEAGTYGIQVWARQIGSSAIYDGWRGTDLFVVNPRPPTVLTSLTSIPISPTTTGVPITWSATASGGLAPLEYKFWLFSSGGWRLLQDYSSSPTATWTPASAGTFAIQVWVRSGGSPAAFDSWRDSGLFTIQDSANIFITDLSPNVPLPATVTQPLTWTVKAAGGAGPLSYRFFRYRQSTGWTMVQDYSTNPSYTWLPELGEDGTYAIQVWVRGAGSTAAYDEWRDSGLFQVVPPTVLFLASKVGDYIGGGVPRLLTTADGAFTATRLYPNTVTIRENTPTYSHFWNLYFQAPDGLDLTPGVYSNATRWPFQAVNAAGLDVSGEGNGCSESWSRFVVREATYGTDGTPTTFAADFEQHCDGNAAALYGSVRFNSTIPLVSVQPLAFSAGSTISIGIPVSWNARTSPDRESRAWLYRASTRTWMLLHDYSAVSTVTWTPQTGDQGDWVLVMWERAAGATGDYDTWRVSDVIKVQ